MPLKIKISILKNKDLCDKKKIFFVYFERLLEILILFQKQPIVDDYLWRGYFQVYNAVVNSFRRLEF